MKTAIIFLAIVLQLFAFSPGSQSIEKFTTSLYSKNKFFVKTKSELKVSEATGNVSFTTGLASLDDKISRYNIIKINKLFNLNNGSIDLYDKYGMTRIYVFDMAEDSKENIAEIIQSFNKDDNIEFSEPDFIGVSAGVKETIKNNFYSKSIPDDEMFYRQWYLQNSGSVEPSSGGGLPKIGADIKILNAWDIEKGSEDVIVAIMDSGIKDDHPDLKDRIWINKNEIANNGIDDDNNGYVDDYKGWDFAYNDKRPEDGFGHGTNIATVIGASTNNAIGYAGVDQKCRLMNCKNLNSDNSGEYGWWAESIKYAVDNGAKIINMSEGGDDYSEVLKTAIDYALESGVLIDAAMMNKGDNRDYYPASYKGVFAVGATDTDDKRCKRFSWGGGSCWGKHISVVAPGNKIYGLDYENNEGYDVYWSGTSQSTAIVSGIAALLLAQNKLRTNEDLKKIIKLSARDLVGDPREDKPGWDQFYGYGRVDSYAALTFENKNLVNPEIETTPKGNNNIKTDDVKQSGTIDEPKDAKPSKEGAKDKPSKADERKPDDK